jgi:hypothetical protein
LDGAVIVNGDDARSLLDVSDPNASADRACPLEAAEGETPSAPEGDKPPEPGDAALATPDAEPDAVAIDEPPPDDPVPELFVVLFDSLSVLTFAVSPPELVSPSNADIVESTSTALVFFNL